MSKKIEALLEELFHIDPSLRNKQETLYKIVQKLLAAKPVATMDASFRKNLKTALLKRIEENPGLVPSEAEVLVPSGVEALVSSRAGEKPSRIIRFFALRGKLVLGFGLASAAMIIAALVLFLPRSGNEVAFNQSMSALEENRDEISRDTGPEKSLEKYAAEGSIKDDVFTSADALIPTNKTDTASLIADEQYDLKTKVTGGTTLSDEEKESGSGTIAGKTEIVSGERNEVVAENDFARAIDTPALTEDTGFGTGSYDEITGYIAKGILPPPDSVRIEELVNHFSFDLPVLKRADNLSIYGEISECPWDGSHRLLLIGLSGNTEAVSGGATVKKKAAQPGDADALTIAATDIDIRLTLDAAYAGSYRSVGNPETEKKSGDASAILYNGKSVIALYEIVPATIDSDNTKSESGKLADAGIEWPQRGAVKITVTYKTRERLQNKIAELTITDAGSGIASATGAFKFASAIAEWGLVLQGSVAGGKTEIDRILGLVKGFSGATPHTAQKDFISKIEASRNLFEKYAAPVPAD